MAYRRELPRDEIPEADTPSGLEDVLEFPLVQALLGRRSRRFFLGASIPDGPMAFTSRSEPEPLSELEQMLLVTAVGGNTGWHYLIARNEHYAPSLSNYAGSAGREVFTVGRIKSSPLWVATHRSGTRYSPHGNPP